MRLFGVICTPYPRAIFCWWSPHSASAHKTCISAWPNFWNFKFTGRFSKNDHFLIFEINSAFSQLTLLNTVSWKSWRGAYIQQERRIWRKHPVDANAHPFLTCPQRRFSSSQGLSWPSWVGDSTTGDVLRRLSSHLEGICNYTLFIFIST